MTKLAIGAGCAYPQRDRAASLVDWWPSADNKSEENGGCLVGFSHPASCWGAVAVRRGLDSFFWKLLDRPDENLAELLGWSAAVLAAFVVLIWGIVRIRSLFRDDDDPAAVDQSMLLGLGDLHRQGDLSESEYRSIKSQLIQRMQDPPSHNSEKQP